MNVEAFLDSNIPLYAASKDPKDAVKREKAAKLMIETRFGISLQVAQESERFMDQTDIPAQERFRMADGLMSRGAIQGADHPAMNRRAIFARRPRRPGCGSGGDFEVEGIVLGGEFAAEARGEVRGGEVHFGEVGYTRPLD
jgi:hypothetical protein